jgi:hypothetical protein
MKDEKKEEKDKMGRLHWTSRIWLDKFYAYCPTAFQ